MRLEAKGALRVLDFDLENMPLAYVGGDFTTPDVTAIAWKFAGDKVAPRVAIAGEVGREKMLLRFLEAYKRADVVTGHNIIRHDLPHLNAMFVELGWPPLTPVLVQDTYIHLKRRASGFASQAFLASALGVESPKVGVAHFAWRQENRERGTRGATRRRVAGDVIQHLELRAKLIELGWLRPPRRWES